MTQNTLDGKPLEADRAPAVFDGDTPRCGHIDDETGAECVRYATIGVKFTGNGWVPVCDHHATAAWLHAAHGD